MKKIIDSLPKRFQWSVHNCIGHPLMEIAYQFGFKNLSYQIHEITQPSAQHQTLNKDQNN